MAEALPRDVEQELDRLRPPVLTLCVCLLSLVITAGYQAAALVDAGPLVGLFQYASLPPEGVWSGGYYSLVTSSFVHGSPNSFISTLVHLGFNMLYMYELGRLLEHSFRAWRFALFYVLSAAVASGCELAFTGHIGVGVSGVVYAMFGLMWAGRHRYPLWRFVATTRNFLVLVAWGLFCVLMTRLQWLQVANAAHFGGLAFGLGVGWVLYGRRGPVAGALVVTSLGVLTILSATFMPWSRRWTAWKAGECAAERKWDQAYYWYGRTLELGGDPIAVWTRILLMESARGNNEGTARALRRLAELGALRRYEPPSPGPFHAPLEGRPAPLPGQPPDPLR